MKSIVLLVWASSSLVLVDAAAAQPSPAPSAATLPAPLPQPTTIAPAPTTPLPAGEVMSLEQALAVARQQNPSIRSTQATIDAAHARIDLAGVPLRPTTTVSASITDGSNGGQSGGFLVPTLSTGVSAQAAWRLYDFGLTKANVRVAQANAAASDAVMPTTMLDITNAVTIAYLDAVARARLVISVTATVENEAAHLDQARRFVAAQAKDPIEVVQAQARAANARSSLAQAQSDAAVALAALRAAIGSVSVTADFNVDPNWPIPPRDAPEPLANLVAFARKNRPELVQLDRQVAAAEASVNATRAERRPFIAANAQTQWNPSSNNWTPQPSWIAGLSISWQFYDGGRSAANRSVATASVAGALAQRDALLIALQLQLESARAQIIANTANVIASTEAVAAAHAQLNLANARYKAGLGSQIELGDAQTSVTTAEGNLIGAEWQRARAWAQLQRALGRIDGAS